MKKNGNVVGVVPLGSSTNFFQKKNISPAAKKVMPPEKFFTVCGLVWIEVYGKVVKPPPGEEIADPRLWKDAVEKRHLKLILKDLRERAEEKKIVWDEETATKRFRAFIERAGEDEWISNNFLLRIINNNKTKIFNNQITKKTNGQVRNNHGGGGTKATAIISIKPKGGFGKL